MAWRCWQLHLHLQAQVATSVRSNGYHIMHDSSHSVAVGITFQIRTLTQKREAAAAGNRFNLKVCHCPRNDGLHLAAEELDLLRLLRARLAYKLANSVLELQCTPAGVFVCCLAVALSANFPQNL